MIDKDYPIAALVKAERTEVRGFFLTKKAKCVNK